MRVRVSWYSCQPPIPETSLVVTVTGKQSARAIATARLTKKHRPGRAYHFEWKPDVSLPDDPPETNKRHIVSRHSWLEDSLPPSDR
jgi:hypothetical protein